MIVIKVFNNGVKINGHADVRTCELISFATTILTNNIIIFQEVNYYTSELDEDKTKHLDGYTELEFEKTEIALQLLEEYYRQILDCIKEQFFPRCDLVKIEKINNEIVLERVMKNE